MDSLLSGPRSLIRIRSEYSCVRVPVCVCVCVCALRIVSRDKVFHFTKSLIIIIRTMPYAAKRFSLGSARMI